MTMPRTVAAETLDGLAADDPAALRSRRDLRRVHQAMGTRSIVLRAWRDLTASRRKTRPFRVLELGAGDGSLMLGVAGALGPSAAPVELTLLDRQALVSRATIEGFAALGWAATAMIVDVRDWSAGAVDPSLEDSAAGRWDLIVANLFLHHFEGAPLGALLNAIVARCDRFFACEPHRGWFALAGSRLVGALGANAVTREDAVLSVRAGFRGSELGAFWPGDDAAWQVREYSAGPFSHCFRAQRLSCC